MRRVVKLFAGLMEDKLRENDGKGGWDACTVAYLLHELELETVELKDALDQWRAAQGRASSSEIIAAQANVRSEAVDVANFAMMIADRFGALCSPGREPVESWPLHCGQPSRPAKDVPAFVCMQCGAVFQVRMNPICSTCDGVGCRKCEREDYDDAP